MDAVPPFPSPLGHRLSWSLYPLRWVSKVGL